MALSILTSRPTFQEDEDLLALEPFGDDFEKSLRPSLADKLQVGFLSSDQYCQTYDTEILEIKQMTDTVKTLVQDLATLKKEFQFSRQVIQAAFEKKLHDKAFELHSKLNDRLRDLQKLHEEKVLVIRRSFKQQLKDAMIKMAAHYKKYYESKLAGKLLPDSGGSKAKAKIMSLEMELNTTQSIVVMLETQVEQLREELASRPDPASLKVDTAELDTLKDENRDLQMELMKVNDRVDELTETIKFRENTINDLTFELAESKSETQKQKETSKRLAYQLDENRKKWEAEKHDAMNLLSKQKQALEDDMAKKLAKTEEREQHSARERDKMLATMEQEMARRLAEERQKSEKEIAEIREAAQKKSREMEGSLALMRVVEEQRHEILALRQRHQKSQKQWEKKFEILRASLHALKDEGYIRMQLQKQAATLKYASISYGPDANVQLPSQHPNLHSNIGHGASEHKPFHASSKPLPAIIKAGRFSFDEKKTTTIPSGEHFSDNEEDDEDDHEPEDGFVPLPPKPTPNVGDYMPVANNDKN